MGIGVSAGGLKAFSELLTRLPENTDLSFVFIQHLDPFHESWLKEVLQQRTAIFGDGSERRRARARSGRYVPGKHFR